MANSSSCGAEQYRPSPCPIQRLARPSQGGDKTGGVEAPGLKP